MTNDALKALDDVFFDMEGNREYWSPETVKQYETIRAALAPVDVEGLANYIRAINGDNTMGAGELAEKITDHLAARGFGVPEGCALVPIEPDFLEGARSLRDTFGWPNQVERAKHCYKAMIKAAPKKEEK